MAARPPNSRWVAANDIRRTDSAENGQNTGGQEEKEKEKEGEGEEEQEEEEEEKGEGEGEGEGDGGERGGGGGGGTRWRRREDRLRSASHRTASVLRSVSCVAFVLFQHNLSINLPNIHTTEEDVSRRRCLRGGHAIGSCCSLQHLPPQGDQESLPSEPNHSPLRKQRLTRLHRRERAVTRARQKVACAMTSGVSSHQG